MSKFKVLKPIVFDGTARAPGKTIEASAERIRHALVKGYVERVEAEPKSSGKRS